MDHRDHEKHGSIRNFDPDLSWAPQACVSHTPMHPLHGERENLDSADEPHGGRHRDLAAALCLHLLRRDRHRPVGVTADGSGSHPRQGRAHLRISVQLLGEKIIHMGCSSGDMKRTGKSFRSTFQ